jgi:transcriptional regulator NrdR family protein
MCRANGVNAGTEVAYTRTSANRDSIVRRRRCRVDPKHTFTTEESTRRGAVEIWIRRRTDGKIGSRFSPARLQRDILRIALGRINQPQLSRVLAEVGANLLERLSEYGEPLTAAERDQLQASSSAVAIWDDTVMEEVERSLNDTETRIPHVLYALGVRGQANLAHRSGEYAGFNDASAFLAWLFAEHNYARLGRALPPPQTQRAETWWSPTNLLHPETVIKRSGERRAFDFEQFRKSIQLAMRGRSRWVLESNELANWVLVQVEGQRRVTSSQLSALVSTALRRADDIAYLRWAIAAKGLTSVAEIADEAEDLIVHPSVRLRFAPEGQPRIDTAAPSGGEPGTDLVSRLRSLADELETA